LDIIHDLMLDKKKWAIPMTISIIAIGGWGIRLFTSEHNEIQMSRSNPIATEQKNPTIETSIDNNPQLEKIANEVTVRILTDTAPGSGVIIEHKGTTYTALTCHHVIAGTKKSSYRVLLPDGKIYTASVKSTPRLKGLDLAVVEFKSATDYRVVKLGESHKLVPDSPVYSSGFPNYQTIDAKRIEETSSWGRRAFRFTTGKVGSIDIAPRSLPEGYSLGYTNEVASGMSGGPVFNDKGELVGINGRLKYPVQGIEAFIFDDGSKPSVEKFEQMEALSWAIPISKMK
jgi:serine protease Do